MRRRRRYEEEQPEVPMSPLIDCVFLLLIFFLVTSMIKRREQLIPITLPDSSSVISSDTTDDTIIIGLSKSGHIFKTSGSANNEGAIRYIPVADLSAYLKELVQQQGHDVLNRALRIDADRDTPFQIAVDAVDICKLQGFQNVGLKTRAGKR